MNGPITSYNKKCETPFIINNFKLDNCDCALPTE